MSYKHEICKRIDVSIKEISIHWHSVKEVHKNIFFYKRKWHCKHENETKRSTVKIKHHHADTQHSTLHELWWEFEMASCNYLSDTKTETSIQNRLSDLKIILVIITCRLML